MPLNPEAISVTKNNGNTDDDKPDEGIISNSPLKKFSIKKPTTTRFNA
ncbi:hypothetical protein GCM10008967_42300 [Bacillus carboniphilus]|uniref:Uncharacterized protein n=1 Tax=Bacillus carboniphilus TaxID=86663 RepID=A0ABP3GLR8_9BACI